MAAGDYPAGHATAIYLLRDLLVVLLAVDPGALAVLRLLDARALLGGHLAVGRGLVFHALHALLALLEAALLVLVQRARRHALVDALVLHGLALVDALGRLGLRERE